jgi:urease accessory protein
MTELKCQPPLQVLRLHHVDPAVPDLATAILASPSGGILDGDRIHLDVVVGPGARLHLGTQSATRIYRTPGIGARFDSLITVAEGAYLELMPDPYIPYRASRFAATTRCEVAPGGTLLIREVVGPGRSARGEVLAFDHFESTIEILRPDGSFVATDTVRLDPAEDLGQAGLLGVHRCVGSLIVVHEGFSPDVLIAGAESVTSPCATAARTSWGASSLPGGAGAWLRVLAPDEGTAGAVLRAAWAAARDLLIGAPLPADHRF